MASYHQVQYQKKTNNQILRKRSDRRTRMFIGRCPTNVKRPLEIQFPSYYWNKNVK